LLSLVNYFAETFSAGFMSNPDEANAVNS